MKEKKLYEPPKVGVSRIDDELLLTESQNKVTVDDVLWYKEEDWDSQTDHTVDKVLWYEEEEW